MAILRLAEAHGERELVWMMARSAWRIWFMAAEYDDLIEAHKAGLAAAQSAGDEYAVAVMTNYLSSGLYRVGRVREARTCSRRPTTRSSSWATGRPRTSC